jgi:ABC-type Fe3+ transport system substrate-binding protein
MKKLFIILLLLLFGFKTNAFANSGNLVIITSFSKDLTENFKTEFEKKYPSIKVEILQKGTPAGVKYIQETKSNNATDLFWVSAPDANEVLKKDSLLFKYTPKVKGIPEKIGSYPTHDKDGYYLGFAASGYGIMWNTRYLSANKIPKPKEWSDLIKPVYYNHVGMSSPSRSGTTHLTLEAILQGEGFSKGWSTMKFVAGNFKTVAATSFAVP